MRRRPRAAVGNASRSPKRRGIESPGGLSICRMFHSPVKGFGLIVPFPFGDTSHVRPTPRLNAAMARLIRWSDQSVELLSSDRGRFISEFSSLYHFDACSSDVASFVSSPPRCRRTPSAGVVGTFFVRHPIHPSHQKHGSLVHVGVMRSLNKP